MKFRTTTKFRFTVMTAAVAGTMLGAAVLHTFAADIVEIRLRGHFFSEPATVEITIAVEPDAANRMLRIEADGDQVFRSTEVKLEGESDKRIHVVEFKNLPAGSYELRAQVLSQDKVRAMATQEMMVAGPGSQ
jgi:hypothetical protein